MGLLSRVGSPQDHGGRTLPKAPPETPALTRRLWTITSSLNHTVLFCKMGVIKLAVTEQKHSSRCSLLSLTK